MSPKSWTEVLSDAERFLSGWGVEAQSLGWTGLDLFGVHIVAPSCRYDAMGLLWLIQGGEITALTKDMATIRRRSGAVLTCLRPNFPDAVLIYWRT
jgi:hypothetical protein